jgi:hypothetical protein
MLFCKLLKDIFANKQFLFSDVFKFVPLNLIIFVACQSVFANDCKHEKNEHNLRGDLCHDFNNNQPHRLQGE